MKIGFIDSGIGGFSVLNAFIAESFHANYYYIADSGHLPYGTKSDQYIHNRIERLTQYLIYEIEVDALIIACNTATAVSANKLREQYTSFPIIGIEPAIKPATQLTKTRHIAVAATYSMLRSRSLLTLIDTYAKNIYVHKIEGGAWVKLVEQSLADTKMIQTVIQQTLQQINGYPIDQFILGCTHFPFLRTEIQNELGDQVNIIDPAKSIVARTLSFLMPQKMLSLPAFHYYTTGEKTLFTQQIGDLHMPLGTIEKLSL